MRVRPFGDSVTGDIAMSLTLDLPTDVEAALEEVATGRGMSSEELARNLIVQGVFRKPSRSWAEIAAPIAEDFKASEMTEEELDALVEEVREDIYFEQHGQRSKQP